MTSATSGPIPLILGVVSDGDIHSCDNEILEVAVSEVFGDLRRAYPATSLMLLASPVREGDRLAARVALRCGVRVALALPPPAGDAPSQSAETACADLLARADTVFTLPGPATGDGDAGAEYARAAAHIARHSQILLALWDGGVSDSLGSAGRIVRLKLEGGEEPLLDRGAPATPRYRSTLEPAGAGPVYHILAPQAAPLRPDQRVGQITRMYRWPCGVHGRDEPEVRLGYEQIFENMETFNEGALELESDPALRRRREEGMEALMPAEYMETAGPALNDIRRVYGVADTLALRFGHGTRNTVAALFGLALAAGISFELYAHLPRGEETLPRTGETIHAWLHPTLILAYAAVLGVAYLVWHTRIQKQGIQDRYQDYRALAEGLRILFYWRFAGMADSVTQHYLLNQRSELDWIRRAIRVWDMPLDGAPAPRDGAEGEEAAVRMQLVFERWIERQREFFATRTRRNQQRWERHERSVGWLLWASVAAVAMAVALEFSHAVPWATPHGELIHAAVVMAIAIPLLLAALAHAIADQDLLQQAAKQYKRMYTLFTTAEAATIQHLAGHRFDEGRQLLRDLGHEALAENGVWVLEHRERPVQFHHAG